MYRRDAENLSDPRSCSVSRWRILAVADLLRGFAAIGLDAIAVGIGDEGGVVIGAVILPQPGLAVVAPARAQGFRMKRIDRFAVGGAEADVQAGGVVGRHRMLRGADPERHPILAV